MAQFVFHRLKQSSAHDLLHDHIGFIGEVEVDAWTVSYQFSNLTDEEFDWLVEQGYDLGLGFDKNLTHNNFQYKCWLTDMVKALHTDSVELINRQLIIYEENIHYWCHLPHVKRVLKDEVVKAAKEQVKILNPIAQ